MGLKNVLRLIGCKKEEKPIEEPVELEFAPIDILNDYCLMHIFEILPIKDRLNVEKVCTRWEEVSRYCWNKVTKNDLCEYFASENKLHRKHVVNVLKRCSKMSQVCLCLNKHRTRSISRVEETSEILAALWHMKNLKYFTWDFHIARFNIMHFFEAKMPQLEKIVISSDDDINSREFVELLSIAKKLKFLSWQTENSGSVAPLMQVLPVAMKTLVIKSTYRVKLDNVFKFLDRLENLEELSVYSSWMNLDETCVRFPNKLRHLILTKFFLDTRLEFLFYVTNLQSLVVCGGSIDENHLHDFVRNNQKLEHLHIASCTNMTDEKLMILTKLTNLKSLTLGNLRGISGTALSNFTSLEKLELYKINGLKEQNVHQIITNAPNLTELILDKPSLDKEAIKNIKKSITNRQVNYSSSRK